MCVSGQWLVVTFWNEFSTAAIRLYRLPDLAQIGDLNYSTVYRPRCSSNGRVYVPAVHVLIELEIKGPGNLTILRNITLGDLGDVEAVTAGPQTGQQVPQVSPGHLYCTLLTLIVAK